MVQTGPATSNEEREVTKSKQLAVLSPRASQILLGLERLRLGVPESVGGFNSDLKHQIKSSKA